MSHGAPQITSRRHPNARCRELRPKSAEKPNHLWPSFTFATFILGLPYSTPRRTSDDAQGVTNSIRSGPCPAPGTIEIDRGSGGIFLGGLRAGQPRQMFLVKPLQAPRSRLLDENTPPVVRAISWRSSSFRRDQTSRPSYFRKPCCPRPSAAESGLHGSHPPDPR